MALRNRADGITEPVSVSVPKTTIIWVTVAEIKSKTDFFLILKYFLPFYPLTTQKIKILKKGKKTLKTLSFYTSVP